MHKYYIIIKINREKKDSVFLDKRLILDKIEKLMLPQNQPALTIIIMKAEFRINFKTGFFMLKGYQPSLIGISMLEEEL